MLPLCRHAKMSGYARNCCVFFAVGHWTRIDAAPHPHSESSFQESKFVPAETGAHFMIST